MYPEEQAEPAGFAPGITLRPYQRQSLAFMMNLETSTDPKITGGRQSTSDKGKGLREGHAVRGGFLVDEMVRALPIELAAAAHAPTCGLHVLPAAAGDGQDVRLRGARAGDAAQGEDRRAREQHARRPGTRRAPIRALLRW